MFSLTRDWPCGSENSKTQYSSQFSTDFTKLHDISTDLKALWLNLGDGPSPGYLSWSLKFNNQAVKFLGDLQITKILWDFEIILNTGPWGAEISKHHSYSFYSISAKLDDKYRGDRESLAITFHGDLPNIKTFTALWHDFNMAVNGKS